MSNSSLILGAGVPRSGTSMLMRMLILGGIDVDYDPSLDSAERHQQFGNPHGFFETNCKHSGRTVKITNISELKSFPEAQVIYIHREPDSLLKSWEVAKLIGDPIAEHNLFVEELKHYRHLKVKYEEVHFDPQKSCRAVKEFLSGMVDFDYAKALTAVDHTLWRNK